MRSDSDILRDEEFEQRIKEQKAQQKLEHEVFERVLDRYKYLLGRNPHKHSSEMNTLVYYLSEELSQKIIKEMEGE